MKILCVLYDDPKGGMPKSYPLSDLPKLEKYPDGMTLPSPKGRDFTPGELLGCVSGGLGLKKYLESNGHEFIVTNSKDGEGCEADKHIVDADIVISQPFFPYYLTKERIAKANTARQVVMEEARQRGDNPSAGSFSSNSPGGISQQTSRDARGGMSGWGLRDGGLATMFTRRR